MKNNDCCPKFDAKKWDKKIHNWNGKKFVYEIIKTNNHIPNPLDIQNAIMKMYNKIISEKTIGANPEETLILFNDLSDLEEKIMISVDKETKDLNNMSLTGEFISMVFDGDFTDVPLQIKEFDGYLKSIGKKAKDYFIHYAYCPECIKKYGHNWSVMFALV